MDEFDVLIEELEVSDTKVLGALFCLENLDMPDEGALPAAAVIWSAAVARIQVEKRGILRPSQCCLTHCLIHHVQIHERMQEWRTMGLVM